MKSFEKLPNGCFRAVISAKFTADKKELEDSLPEEMKLCSRLGMDIVNGMTKSIVNGLTGACKSPEEGIQLVSKMLAAAAHSGDAAGVQVFTAVGRVILEWEAREAAEGGFSLDNSFVILNGGSSFTDAKAELAAEGYDTSVLANVNTTAPGTESAAPAPMSDKGLN